MSISFRDSPLIKQSIPSLLCGTKQICKRVSEIARRNICLVPHNKLGIDCFIRGESLKEIDFF
jgi:hypothetical protein